MPVLNLHLVQKRLLLGDQRMAVIGGVDHLGRQRRAIADTGAPHPVRLQRQVPKMVRGQHIHVRGKHRRHHGCVAPVAFKPVIGRMRPADRRAFGLGEILESEILVLAHLAEFILGDGEVCADRLAVGHRKMVALHEILGQAFPVRVPDMLFGEDRAVMFLPVTLDYRCQRGQLDRHRRGITIQRQIDPALIDFAADTGEAQLVAVKAVCPLHMRRGGKPPVYAICPGMVGTGKTAGVAVAFDQPHHPVPAGVGMRAHRAVLATDKDHRLRTELVGHVIAGRGDFVLPAGTKPAFGKDLFLFARQNLGSVIQALRRRRRLGKRTRRERFQLCKNMIDSHVPSGHLVRPFPALSEIRRAQVPDRRFATRP